MGRNTWIWIGLLLLAFAAGNWFASHRASTAAPLPAPTTTSSREMPAPLPRSAPATMQGASGLPARTRACARHRAARAAGPADAGNDRDGARTRAARGHCAETAARQGHARAAAGTRPAVAAAPAAAGRQVIARRR
jgi:hypothetical protein